MLWTVRGEHNTVYLFGSIHVLRPGDGGLPPRRGRGLRRRRAARDGDRPGRPGQWPTRSPWRRRCSARRCCPLDSPCARVLGADYASIAERARAAGTRPRPRSTASRPGSWRPCCCSSSSRSAASTPSSASSSSWRTAPCTTASRSSGSRRAGQQFAVLGGLSLAEQKRFLLMTLEETERIRRGAGGTAGGVAHRATTAALARVLSEAFEEFPELYRPLTEDRNRAWVERARGTARRPRRLPRRRGRTAPRRPQQRGGPAAAARPHRHAALRLRRASRPDTRPARGRSKGGGC